MPTMFLRHSARSGRWLGVLLLLVARCCIGASAIGVNYGTLGNNLPSPAQVVQLVQSTYITHVKIYSADANILSAFANSGISLVVGVTNDEVNPIAASESYAQQWVTMNVASHYPSTNIVYIVVGNEVLTTAPNQTYDLVPAMQNLYTGLKNLGLSDKIKVSTPNSFGVLGTSYPPSSGTFRTDLSGPVFAPMLDFLSQTGAPFMINPYPYFAYRDNTQISISYALFEPGSVVVDEATGLNYNNLFDAQVDATYAAMAKLGHQDISVTTSETGWPSLGDPDEVGISVTNAQTYTGNLLQHINSNAGTPTRPGVPIDTYIFAMFNENQKPGPTSERNFGLFYPDMTTVYNVGLVTANTNVSSPPPPNFSTPPSPPPPAAASPSPTPSSSPPPSSSSPSPPPPFTTTSPPPFVSPPPPYPVPHVPPMFSYPPPPASSAPSPSAAPPPAMSFPPPVTSPPPPSSSSPPPASPPPSSSPPPPAPPPPSSSSPPPASPPPSSSTPPPAPPPPSSSSPPSASPPPSSSPPPPAPPPPSSSSPPASPPPSSSPPPPAPPSPPPSLPPAVPSPVSPSPGVGSPPQAPPGTPPAPPGTASGPDTWCVSKPGAATADLSNALTFACGPGGADCTPIQAGGACYNPNNLFSHASYAVSSYYANNGRNYWNCFFGNSSLITITNPSYAACNYP